MMSPEVLQGLALVRSALFMPASNARAVEKARSLAADMIILDLEDAVADDAKDAARDAAVAAAATGFGERLCAIRINGGDAPWHDADVAAVAGSAADVIVVPKVEDAGDMAALARRLGKPVIAMIETPQGLYAARDIAAVDGVAGLFAGTNDLAAELGLELEQGQANGQGRAGLCLSLQMIVLAAAAARIPAFDGVNNNLDDLTDFHAECAEARRFGFVGKTLIHPKQVEPANAAFAPTAAQLDDARALIAAASGGAERFRGRMVEAMHVAQARRLLARAGIAEPDPAASDPAA